LKKQHADDELKESNRRLEFFLQVSQSMDSTLDKKRLMQMIVDNAVMVTGFDSGAIYLLNGKDSIVLEATVPPLTANLPEVVLRARLKDHPHIEKAIRTGTSVFMPNAFEARLTAPEQEIIELKKLHSKDLQIIACQIAGS